MGGVEACSTLAAVGAVVTMPAAVAAGAAAPCMCALRFLRGCRLGMHVGLAEVVAQEVGWRVGWHKAGRLVSAAMCVTECC